MRSERWVVFALLFTTRTTIAYQFQSLASVGPYVIDALAIDFVQLTALIGFYMLPGVLLAFPGGMVDRRLGGKRTMMLGLALMVAGTAVMAPGSVGSLFAGRLVSGAGAAILNVVLARAIAGWFSDAKLSGVMGLFVASWPLGIALSLLSVPALTLAFGWPALVLGAAVPCLTCLAFIAVLYRDTSRPDMPAPPPRRHSLTRPELIDVSLSGLAWGFYNVAYIVFVASMPELLIHDGYSITEAGAFTSILGWVMMLVLPLGGYISQSLRRPAAATCLCLLLIAAAGACLALTPARIPFLLILAGVIGLPAGFLMALPARILAIDKRPTGMGVFFTIFYAVMAVVPSGAGLARQYSGQVSSAVLFGVIVALLACLSIFMVGLREPRSATVRLGASTGRS